MAESERAATSAQLRVTLIAAFGLDWQRHGSRHDDEIELSEHRFDGAHGDRAPPREPRAQVLRGDARGARKGGLRGARRSVQRSPDREPQRAWIGPLWVAPVAVARETRAPGAAAVGAAHAAAGVGGVVGGAGIVRRKGAEKGGFHGRT